MANKVFNSFKVNQKHPRNGFDCSYRNLFTMPSGALIPFFVKDVNPGDHLKISVNCETRSVQMTSFTFQRFRQHFDYYFVPYRLLWKWFPQFIAATDDYGSSLPQYLESDEPVSSYQPVKSVVTQATCPWISTSTLGDLLSSSSSASAGAWVTSNYTDDLGYSYKEGFNRLCNGLEIDPNLFDKVLYSDNTTTDVNDPHAINLWRFLAYQKIYQDYYRNTDYEEANPYAYNLDYKSHMSTSGNNEIASSSEVLRDWFKLRYALLNRDAVTYIKPYMGSSFVGSLTSGQSDLPPYQGFKPLNTEGLLLANPSGGEWYTRGISGKTGLNAMSDFRSAKALDKMSRIQMMAEKRYSSQIKAHYGENVNVRDDNRCIRLGSSMLNVGIQEVTSTADSGQNSLGSIGAKSYGQFGSKPISYDANEHGVVLGLSYIEPLIDYQTDYQSPFFDKITKNAYFQPELDGLGLQPQYGRYMQTMDNAVSSSSKNDTALKVFGYQPRYMEYKSSRDVVSQSFKDNYPTWVAPRDPFFRYAYNSSYSAINAQTFFHIDPAILDDLFYSNYNGSPETDQFQVCLNNNVMYVTNMSISGLPRF